MSRTKRCVPIYVQTSRGQTKTLCSATPKCPPARPAHPTCVPAYRTLFPITMAKVRCSECNRIFTPRGHSQHVSKSHDPRCRSGNAIQHTQLVSASFPHNPFPLAIDPNHARQGSGRNSPDELGAHNYGLGGHDVDADEHDGTESESPESGGVSPNGSGEFDVQLPDGKSSVRDSRCRLELIWNVSHVQMLVP